LLDDARFLITSSRAWSTELLGFASPWVRDQQGAVVSDQILAEFQRGSGVSVLGRVSDDGAGEGLADGVDLGGVSTARHLDADVDGLEGVAALGGRGGAGEDEDGLVGLQPKDLGFDQMDGLAVDADLTFTSFCVGDSSCGLHQEYEA
jgi:hypothetical protein